MRARKLIAMLAALALIAAACGGDDDAEETTTTTASDTTTTTEVEDTTTTTAVDPTADWPEKVIFGFIPSERAETLQDDIQPIMTALSDILGIEVEGIVTADYNGLVVAMGNEQADIGAFGPFGYVQAEQQYPEEIEVLAQSFRFGADTYHGQWFATPEVAAEICEEPPAVGALDNRPRGDVNAVPELVDVTEVLATIVGFNSGTGNTEAAFLDDGTPIEPGLACLASIDNIKGRRVAFGSATSTSASIFPRLQLLNAGFDLESDIEFSYLGSHDDAVLAVYNGDFDVGVSFDDARRNVDGRSEGGFPDVGSNVIVFNITGEIPNDVVAIRSNLPDSFKQAFYDAVESYLATDEGKEAFDQVYEWSAIRPAVDSDFNIVRDAATQLGITED